MTKYMEYHSKNSIDGNKSISTEDYQVLKASPLYQEKANARAIELRKTADLRDNTH